jgi:hypothetical protein
MKKVLFLLLLTVASYGQTLQNPTYGTVKLKNNSQSINATKVNVQDADGSINYKDKEIFTENSAGAISGFALTNNGNGTVNIASGYALVRNANDENATLQKYLISAVTNLALTDNVNNYVIVQYNGGSPNMVVITDPNLITTTNNTLIYVIARYGTTINYLYTGEQNVDSNGKLRRRFLNIEPIKRAAGAVIGFTNRNISTTAGLFYGGLTPYTTPLLGATFTNVYNNGSVWTRQTAQTQVNNTQYNLNGVLTNMTNGRFRTDFVYIMVNNPSVLYTVMGTSQTNTLADARLVTMPSALPVELQRLGVLVGRLIIGTNNATITEVSSAYEITFNASTVINHNDTGNIQGGAVGDYQHVTTTDKATWDGKANLAGPQTFTGVHDFPTATAGTNTTQVATTAFVTGANANNVFANAGVQQTILGQKVFNGTQTQFNKSIYVTTDVGNASAITIDASGTSSGVYSNVTTAGTGNAYEGLNNNVLTFKVDKLGNVTATAHVTTGGTSAQLVGGDGVLQDKSQFQTALTNPVTGTGTVNFISKWTAAGVQGDSQIFDNSTSVGIGTNSTQGKLTILNDGISLVLRNITNGTLATPSSRKISWFSSVPDERAFIDVPDVRSQNNGVWMAFSTRSSSNIQAERMRISINGNLLVNTTTDNTVDIAQFNGTISASPATTANQVVVKSQLDAVARPYKVYTALISQTGTNAPVATVLENTLGGTVVWSRTAAGEYEATLSGAFTTNKTVCFVTIGANTASNIVSFKSFQSTTSVVKLQAYNSTSTAGIGTGVDSAILLATFEIRVYN